MSPLTSSVRFVLGLLAAVPGLVLICDANLSLTARLVFVLNRAVVGVSTAADLLLSLT